MELRASYGLRGDPKKIIERVKPQILQQIEGLVQEAVNAYLDELAEHMGNIPGTSSYTDADVSWQPLDEETLKTDPKFWYKTGRAAKSIVVNMSVTGDRIRAFAGIPSSSDAIQEVLWNELGFTPSNGDKLVRRPLFIPVAERQLAELNTKLRETLRNARLRVEIPV